MHFKLNVKIQFSALFSILNICIEMQEIYDL